MNFFIVFSICILSIFSLQGIGNDSIDLLKSEKRIFSQNGEDGVINKIFEIIGTASKYYVEFGASDGYWLSNTRLLRERYNWKGLLLDIEHTNQALNLHKEFITAENINDLFIKYNVPHDLDLLSIDIDGNDFYVWQALSDEYRPRLIVVEYNALHPANEDKVIEYSPQFAWDKTNYFGASILAFYNLARKKGYSLVYAESGYCNLFFIRDDLVESCGHHFKNINNVNEIYTPETWGGHKKDYKKRKYVSSASLLK